MSSYRKRTWFGASGGDGAVIGDDNTADYIVESSNPDHHRMVQEEPLAGGAVPARFDRLNEVDELRWTVNRVHADSVAAYLFARTHHGDLETLGYLQDNIGGTEAGSVYLLTASIQTKCLKCDGATTIFEYTVRGGPWTNIKPL